MTEEATPLRRRYDYEFHDIDARLTWMEDKLKGEDQSHKQILDKVVELHDAIKPLLEIYAGSTAVAKLSRRTGKFVIWVASVIVAITAIFASIKGLIKWG